MSDHRIILIPEDQNYIPESPQQEGAETFLRQIAPKAEEFSVEQTDQIELFDCGSNFEAVFCPSCGGELDIEWWQEWMDSDYTDSGFALTNRELPCCGQDTTLQGLRYDFPQGFARFSISAMNPNIGKLDGEQISQFEKLLGCKLRVIYQHL